MDGVKRQTRFEIQHGNRSRRRYLVLRDRFVDERLRDPFTVFGRRENGFRFRRDSSEYRYGHDPKRYARKRSGQDLYGRGTGLQRVLVHNLQRRIRQHAQYRGGYVLFRIHARKPDDSARSVLRIYGVGCGAYSGIRYLRQPLQTYAGKPQRYRFGHFRRTASLQDNRGRSLRYFLVRTARLYVRGSDVHNARARRRVRGIAGRRGVCRNDCVKRIVFRFAYISEFHRDFGFLGRYIAVYGADL